MILKTALAAVALLVAAPTFAADQIRQQTRDPASHVDGATPTQDRTRTRDTTHQASQDASRERSRSMSGSGASKGSGAGGGTGSGSGSAYRGGK
ncbi:MAG: hypothetical protein WCK73_00155 [Deltaproteobacteria bacterium]